MEETNSSSSSSSSSSSYRSIGVVALESEAVASAVIRSLRSSSNSSRHYKQHATSDQYVITNLDSLNRIIQKQSVEVSRMDQLQQDMDDKLSLYVPPTSSISIASHGVCKSIIKSCLSDDSSDEERQTRTGPRNTAAAAHVGSLEDHDDDSDLEDLFRDFTPPVRASVHRQIGRSGAGGVRGIQHQSALRLQSSASALSGLTPAKIRNSSNSSAAWLSLKPGQTVFIPAPSKRTKPVMMQQQS